MGDTTNPATAVSPDAPPPQSQVPASGGGVTHIEADDDTNDADSLADSSLQSDNTSLASSILKYRVENGRRYHGYKDGAYAYPNDDTENERLDLQHNLMCLTFGGKLYVSPAGKDKPLHRILDAGTGTGIWALDFADEHPETEVLGVDLSPIQPSYVPPNLNFLVDDLEAPWTHSNKFDFVYGRMLTGSLGNWDRFMEQALQNLNPGGWIELIDIDYIACDDGTLPDDSYIRKWSDYMIDAAGRLGRSLDSVKTHAENLEKAGFTNVERVVFRWPMNTWPKDPKFKELGVWGSENMLVGIQGFTLGLFTRVLGWTSEEVEVFLAAVRKDVKNRSYHAYWPLVVVYGQKPLEDTAA